MCPCGALIRASEKAITVVLLSARLSHYMPFAFDDVLLHVLIPNSVQS